jgi:hypothetical protein
MKDEKRAIATLYERDIDLLLLEELQSSEEFRRWLSARVCGEENYARHGEANYSVVDAMGRECDLIYVYQMIGEGLFAILIENRIDARAQPKQAEDYLKRGEKGVEDEAWNDFRTCLVAPMEYLRGAPNAKTYQANISYEELLAYFASRHARDERFRWKATLIANAIKKKKEGYQSEISEKATAFAQAYYDLAAAKYPDLALREPKPRPAGNTWMSFRPKWLPKHVVVEHQVLAGAVKLFISGAAERVDDLRASLQPHLQDRMYVTDAGKSVAIVIDVAPAPKSIEIPFEQVRPQMEIAIDAAKALLSMARASLNTGVQF